MRFLIYVTVFVFAALVLPASAAFSLIKWGTCHRRFGRIFLSISPLIIPALCPIALVGTISLLGKSELQGIALIVAASFIMSLFIAMMVIDAGLGGEDTCDGEGGDEIL